MKARPQPVFSVIDEPGEPGRPGDVVDEMLIFVWMRLLAHERTATNWLGFRSVAKKVRLKHGGQKAYVRAMRGAGSSAKHLRPKVQSLFNGRNVDEVAAQLCISRATVYRLLKPAK